LNWPKSTDPLMDKFYIKTGYTPIDELAMPVEDIANTANDYNVAVQGAAAKLLRI